MRCASARIRTNFSCISTCKRIDRIHLCKNWRSGGFRAPFFRRSSGVAGAQVLQNRMTRPPLDSKPVLVPGN